jgi:hypothetical protein
LPFSLNNVVIEGSTNALSWQAVDDRIVQPLLASNPHVNPDIIINHTLIKVCRTLFTRIRFYFFLSTIIQIATILVLILFYN